MPNFSRVQTSWGQLTVPSSVTHFSTSNTCRCYPTIFSQMASLATIKAFSSYFRYNNSLILPLLPNFLPVVGDRLPLNIGFLGHSFLVPACASKYCSPKLANSLKSFGFLFLKNMTNFTEQLSEYSDYQTHETIKNPSQHWLNQSISSNNSPAWKRTE